MDEFQRGYEKAIKEIAERLKVKGINIDEVLNEIQHERELTTRPKILFTKLNKKGDLEFDNDKTTYYVNHPEELELYLSGKQPKKQQKTQFALLTPDDNRYKKILTDIVGKKTKEMCSAENKILYGDLDVSLFGEKSPLYLNALGNQLAFLSQNPFGFNAVCKACDVDASEDTAIQQILEKTIPAEALFIGK